MKSHNIVIDKKHIGDYIQRVKECDYSKNNIEIALTKDELDYCVLCIQALKKLKIERILNSSDWVHDLYNLMLLPYQKQ